MNELLERAKRRAQQRRQAEEISPVNYIYVVVDDGLNQSIVAPIAGFSSTHKVFRASVSQAPEHRENMFIEVHMYPIPKHLIYGNDVDFTTKTLMARNAALRFPDWFTKCQFDLNNQYYVAYDADSGDYLGSGTALTPIAQKTAFTGDSMTFRTNVENSTVGIASLKSNDNRWGSFAGKVIMELPLTSAALYHLEDRLGLEVKPDPVLGG